METDGLVLHVNSVVEGPDGATNIEDHMYLVVPKGACYELYVIRDAFIDLTMLLDKEELRKVGKFLLDAAE